MKKYVRPELEILKLQLEDVMATSSEQPLLGSESSDISGQVVEFDTNWVTLFDE